MTERLPNLSTEQRREHLAKAMMVRKERAEFKQRLKRGEVGIETAIDEDICQRMTVKSLLMSMPGIGDVRATKIMDACDIAENRRVQGLGPRQREKLVASFAS